LAQFASLLAPGWLQDIQITLDGTAPLHDRRRVGPGFPKTFAVIADNIEMALRKGVHISLRMNVDATNAAEMASLSEYCQRRGWHDYPNFYASAAAVTPEGRHETLITPAELVRRTSELRGRLSLPLAAPPRCAMSSRSPLLIW